MTWNMHPSALSFSHSQFHGVIVALLCVSVVIINFAVSAALRNICLQLDA
jgi:hypothetical protein